MTKQKFFKFNFNKADKDFNFYVNDTNIDAYTSILDQENKLLYLQGANKSGKSTLADIWIKSNNAVKYNNNFDFILNTNNHLCIDNIDNNNSEAIFHIVNHSILNNSKILITSNKSIDENNIKINDLNSRLKTFKFLKIYNPDDDMLINILTKLITEKQFMINSSDIFNFIIKRANRSYEEMYYIVKKLDNLSLEKKRQLTIPLIKEIL